MVERPWALTQDTTVYILTLFPHTHAQGGKQSICMSAVVVGTKITRLGDLGAWVTCKQTDSSELAEKLASVYYKLLGMGHERHKSCTFSVQHACDLPAAPTPWPCADVTPLCMLDQDTGKDCQVMKCIHAAQSVVLQCYLYYIYCNGWRACKVCALDSSSIVLQWMSM